jgi:hypothetical protein
MPLLSLLMMSCIQIRLKFAYIRHKNRGSLLPLSLAQKSGNSSRSERVETQTQWKFLPLPRVEYIDVRLSEERVWADLFST